MIPADHSLSVAERIDVACDHFEAEWKAGRHPKLETYLAQVPEADRSALQKALQAVAIELQGVTDTSVTQNSVVDNKPALQETTSLPASISGSQSISIGRFIIRKVLGSGGFGKVYQAYDPQLSREVAVKVPLDEVVVTEADRQRFLKEARAAATINHPNICHIYEVGENAGRPYIVMSLVTGHSVADMLKQRKEPLSNKQIALLVRKVATALATAHEKGIVHRDLKPANIMYDRDRKEIIVMDFGLARGPKLGDAHATQSGIIMGTPAYMSPEQARGDSKEVGPAGDIYSLGVILYELLTGQKPFIGTATEIIGQILHVEPERPASRKKDVDPRLEAICLKAMAKDPAQRYPSMKAFAGAMDHYLRSVQATPSVILARAVEPKSSSAERSSDNRKIEELFDAISEDRKKTRAETAAAVEAAVARARTPRWIYLLLGLIIIVGLTGLAGIIFFTQNDKVKVTIELKDIDLSDKTLTFFLDNKPIAAELLAQPVELKPGEHLLVVKRGNEIVKQLRISVKGGQQPGFDIMSETKGESSSTIEVRNKIVWQPLLSSENDLVPGETTNHDGTSHIVKFENNTLELKGNNARFTPKFSARNYIVRMKIVQFEGYNVMCWARRKDGTNGGYGAYFNNPDPRLQFPPYGLGKQRPGSPYRDLAGSRTRVTDDFPVEYALAVYGDEISVYVNQLRIIKKTDNEFSEGGVAFSVFRDGHAFLRNLEVCVLDNSDLTPDEVYKQEQPINADRNVAEWVVQLAGKVTIKTSDGQEKEVSEASQIPGDGFQVVKVWFWQTKNPAVGEGLHQLAALTHLREVWLPNVQISDAQARCLMGIQTIQVLDLRGTRVTDALVPSLAALPKLEALGLQTAFITDDGMAGLAEHTQLKSLGLRWSKVTSRGIQSLAQLINLEMLELSYLAIDDSVIDTILGFKKLRELDVTGTQISPNGLDRLRKGLPQCNIKPVKK